MFLNAINEPEDRAFMNAPHVNIRAFEPADWRAICRIHALAALQELETSGVNLDAFRPMQEEEDLKVFLSRNAAMVASLENRLIDFVA